ncbi:MAG: hypothetical protein E6G13_12830 [Actinobacteria bacterium]|nr:MAG: hypothetical protein E6G13_12830 [Actinomycetota bacterium]
MADDVEAHEYRLGSAAASIVGMSQQLLQRNDLSEEIKTRVRAIRDLALEIVRDDEPPERDEH